MKMISKILITLLIGSFAHATAHKIGNGGDALVCYADSTRSTITSVKMFDYWEQDQIRHYSGGIALGLPTASVQDKIDIAINRIEKFDPQLGATIKQTAMSIADKIQAYLVTSYTLPEIDDANPRAIPNQPNCFIEQFAVQYKDVATGERRFYIADKFYNHVNTANDDKVGIILHEAIYRYAILKNNATNSDGVRIFNYAIATQQINDLTPAQIDNYIALLKDASLEDKSCIKDPSLLGLYRKDMPMDFHGSCMRKSHKPCYNQNLQVHHKITYNITPTTCVFGDMSDVNKGYIEASVNYDLNILPHMELKNSAGQLNTYKGSHLQFNAAKQRLVMYGEVHTTNNSIPFKILGPLNTYYTCDGKDNTVLKLINDEITECHVAHGFSLNGMNYSLGRLTKVANGNWEFWNLEMPDTENYFPVYGSQMGLRAGVYTGLVDNSLNILSGEIHSGVNTFSADGVNYVMNFSDTFQVTTQNGVSQLTFSPGYFANPRVQNLRVIATAETYSDFCQIFGGQNEFPQYTKPETEYIGVPGEQFYDLTTESIVYKTDENVNVFKKFNCKNIKKSTSIY